MRSFWHRPWSISIRAKVNKFEFRFRAWNLQPRIRFSVLLHLRKFLLKVDSEGGASVVKRRRRRSKWKMVQFLEKIFAPRGRANLRQPKYAIPDKGRSRFLVKDPIPCIAGFLTLLSASVSWNENWEAIIYAAALFPCIILLFKTFTTARDHLHRVLAVLSFILLRLVYIYLKYPIHISAFWKAWKHIVSVGCLNVVTQAVLRRLSLFIGRYKSVGFIASIVIFFLVSMVNHHPRTRQMQTKSSSSHLMSELDEVEEAYSSLRSKLEI
ncbi:hypothetical protein H6P81_016811 [Aristolochia fimbriata]|uniref:Uncharacterized protein n=1 Tax=Aristolochia fimbriata TaxID=158543 RepID=A0AAV7ECH1_ARIFI|nr:hypothetical protein H6P81_016811 [Aristolochia fimbriata]